MKYLIGYVLGAASAMICTSSEDVGIALLVCGVVSGFIIEYLSRRKNRTTTER